MVLHSSLCFYFNRPYGQGGQYGAYTRQINQYSNPYNNWVANIRTDIKPVRIKTV